MYLANQPGYLKRTADNVSSRTSFWPAGRHAGSQPGRQASEQGRCRGRSRCPINIKTRLTCSVTNRQKKHQKQSALAFARSDVFLGCWIDTSSVSQLVSHLLDLLNQASDVPRKVRRRVHSDFQSKEEILFELAYTPRTSLIAGRGGRRSSGSGARFEKRVWSCSNRLRTPSSNAIKSEPL